MSKSSKLVKIVSPIALAIALTACGGGGTSFGNSGGSGGSGQQQVQVSTLLVSVSSQQLLSNGSIPVVISVIARDANNNAIDDAEVFFSVDQDGLIIKGANDGTLHTASLTPGSSVNKPLTVTIASGGITETVVINVVDVLSGLVDSLELSASSQQLLSDGSTPVIISVVAKDSSNNAIEDANIQFSVDGDALLVPATSTGVTKTAELTPGSPTNRTLNVVVRSGDVAETIAIEVVDFLDGQDGVVQSIELSASSRQLLSGSAATPVVISVTAKDQNNISLSGADLNFSVDNGGTLTLNGETGIVQTADLSSGSAENRTMVVTVSSGAISESLTVDVVGTEVNIEGPDAITINKETPYVLKLTDGADKEITNQVVELTSSAGNTIITDTNFQTNESGEIPFTVIAASGGIDTLTANVLGTTFSKTITISGDEFVLTGGSEEININTDYPLSFVWKKNDVPQVGETITLSATRGEIADQTAVTDATGSASFSIFSDTAGQAVITATTDNGLTTTLEREFIATTPFYLNTQADPTLIAPNGSSTIIAKIRDFNDNPVKNKIIDFRLTDTIDGTLSASTAVTDSLGRASISYKAGNSSSAKDGVVINTFIQGFPSIAEDTVKLTVGGNALRLVLGDDNLLEKSDVFYIKKFGVLVTDSAGNPIADQQVSFTVTPTLYRKGIMIPGLDNWVQKIEATCPSEDLDNDGNLDTGEDINNNGILDPGEDIDGDGILSINEDDNNNGSLEPTHDVVVTGTGTTDENGKIVVEAIYPKNTALWTRQRLSASVIVAGTEFIEHTEFDTPITTDDIELDVTPPNRISPYGLSDRCDDSSGIFNTSIRPIIRDALTGSTITAVEKDTWYTVQFIDDLGNILDDPAFTLVSSVVSIEFGASGSNSFRLTDNDLTTNDTGFNITLTVVGQDIPLFYSDDGAPADTQAPILTLNGNADVTLNVGDTYTELGANAIDLVDGVVNVDIIGAGSVDTSVVGTYTILYVAVDAAGNSVDVSRTINVVSPPPPPADTTAPVISITGLNPVDITQGGAYVDAGATAVDDVDGAVAATAISGLPVDTNILGVHTITYQATDSAGNSSTEDRVVNVVP